MFLCLTIVAVVTWIVVYRYRRRRMYELASLIPGPKKELPVIGAAHLLSGNTEDIMKSLQKISYEAMENDGILKVWLGHILYFVVVNPMDLECMLRNCLEKDDLHRFIRKVIGNGAIFAPVSIWRRRRKVLVPAFSPKIVENFVEVFSEQSVKLAERLNTQVDTGMFSLWPFVSTYTFDAVFDIMGSLKSFSYAAMQHDGMVRAWLNHILYFILVNPVDLEMVLKTCLEKDDLHQYLRNIIGNGAIFAPVSIWRRRRKVLVPAFSPKIVDNFVEVFSEQSAKLAKRLDSQVDVGTFSIWPFLSTYTLDSVLDTAMGVKINAQDNPDSPFLTYLNRILNLVCERIFHLWLRPEWLYKLFPQYIEHQKCISEMHDFIDKVIKTKRIELENKKRIIADCESKTGKIYDLQSYKDKTFLDLLVTHSGGDRGYTDIELREEVLTLTIAGTDTSAVATGYTLKLLSKYPDIQEKVYKELYEVFGDSDRRLVKEDLSRLKYLERVVKESLRLFPPVPFIIRKVLEEVTLPTGRVLPAGSGVVISIWGIHRDPKYWGPDAEHFDPDRFLPERFNLTHACSFMPFSSGPRNCPGYQYALMSVKTAVSSIIRRYKVVGEQEPTPIPRIRVKIDIMMKDADGYQMALERRRPNTEATEVTRNASNNNNNVLIK
ncbi:cytochrome P450 4C1-like [Aphomia sociella]